MTIDPDDKLSADIKKYFKGKTLSEVADLVLINYVKQLETENLNNKLNKKNENEY